MPRSIAFILVFSDVVLWAVAMLVAMRGLFSSLQAQDRLENIGWFE